MKDAQKIRVLPDHVANQIAAGEVVERPASALKELLENAIDAGATQIDVEVVAAGKTLIRVSDNGYGMCREDALLSIERFATSKIRNTDDIEQIATLGFRGEALASISSVSRFSILTRRADDHEGSEIIMSGGKIQEVRVQGCAPGTVVTVRNLFFNVPARRKFIRSQQTELFHIKQIFMIYALSHPELSMTLTIDGRKTDDLPGHAEFDQRLRELYPSDFCTSLRLVNYESAEARITGYAGLPTHSRSDRSEQYLFVNGRPTGAAMLAYAVREAYRGLLAKERHPQLFLFISINPALVDVNVHPTKKEVRFHNVAGVRNTVIAAIRKGLAIEAPGLSPSQGDSSTFVRQDFHKTSGLFPAAGVFNDFYIRPQKLPITGDNDNRGKQSPQLIQTDFSSSSRQDRKSPWSWIRILGEVCGIYVVMETEDGLVLMDPHAAHERILYEKLMARINDGEMNSHSLLLPETIEFPGRDAMILKRNMDALKKIGFGIAEFGGDSFVVDAVPACLSEAAPGRLLRDIISCMEEDGVKSGIGPLMEEKIAQAACKSAVKAHKSLSHKEIEALVSQLSKMEMPYTCPHGRPTLIHISRQELNKKFGRA